MNNEKTNKEYCKQRMAKQTSNVQRTNTASNLLRLVQNASTNNPATSGATMVEPSVWDKVVGGSEKLTKNIAGGSEEALNVTKCSAFIEGAVKCQCPRHKDVTEEKLL